MLSIPEARQGAARLFHGIGIGHEKRPVVTPPPLRLSPHLRASTVGIAPAAQPYIERLAANNDISSDGHKIAASVRDRSLSVSQLSRETQIPEVTLYDELKRLTGVFAIEEPPVPPYAGVDFESLPHALQERIDGASAIAQESKFTIYARVVDEPAELSYLRRSLHVGRFKDVYSFVDGIYTGSLHETDDGVYAVGVKSQQRRRPQLNSVAQAMGFDQTEAEYFGHTSTDTVHEGPDTMAAPPTKYYGMHYHQPTVTSSAA